MNIDIDAFKYELICAEKVKNDKKDILVVVHNQLDYVRHCLSSIFEYTQNYELYVWDNASNEETKDYLDMLRDDIHLFRSPENLGFIGPNNMMISKGTSPHIILLNSDTMVRRTWDTHLIGFLQNNPDVLETGYMGGILNEEGKGVGVDKGYDIDFVIGWCACISRETYQKFGLFDNNLKFAFGEDADFSLKLKKEGHKIYACYADYVHHYGNATIKEVEKKQDTLTSFQNNIEYVAKKWQNYLQYERVELHNK